jgi:hypothetical protein
MVAGYPLTSGGAVARLAEEETHQMTRHYGSFLLRYWHLGRGEQRFAVEHIQSGERTTAASLTEVCGWIGERANPAARPPPAGRSATGPANRPDSGGTTGADREREV